MYYDHNFDDASFFGLKPDETAPVIPFLLIYNVVYKKNIILSCDQVRTFMSFHFELGVHRDIVHALPKLSVSRLHSAIEATFSFLISLGVNACENAHVKAYENAHVKDDVFELFCNERERWEIGVAFEPSSAHEEAQRGEPSFHYDRHLKTHQRMDPKLLDVVTLKRV